MSCYEERLQLYLKVNNIADDNADRREAIFLSEMGRDIYQVLSDFRSSVKAASQTLDQLLKKWKDHFERVPNEMAESFKFWTRVGRTCKSVRGASVDRLQVVSSRFSAHEGRPRETPFKNLALIV